MIRRIVYMVLFFVWVSVIFSLSSEPGYISNEKSLKIVNMIDQEVEELPKAFNVFDRSLHYYVRKMGHIGVYFILTCILLGFLTTLKTPTHYLFVTAFLISGVIAGLDELNQTFVSGRDGVLMDVMIDHVGIVLGIAVFWGGRKIIKNLQFTMDN